MKKAQLKVVNMSPQRRQCLILEHLCIKGLLPSKSWLIILRLSINYSACSDFFAVEQKIKYHHGCSRSMSNIVNFAYQTRKKMD